MDSSLNFELTSEALSGVKADAYGLGVAYAAPALFEAGCRKFFVAHLQEAAALKRFLPKEAKIFILNGLQPGGEIFAAANGFVPILNSREQVLNWAAVARSLEQRLPAILQFDTGMSRLGLSTEEIATLSGDASMLDDIEVLFVMSPLACADEGSNQQNLDQLGTMEAFARLFPGA